MYKLKLVFTFYKEFDSSEDCFLLFQDHPYYNKNKQYAINWKIDDYDFSHIFEVFEIVE